MANLGERTFGPAGKPLAALTNAELREEAARRRAARAGSGRAEPAGEPRKPLRRVDAVPRHVRQWYANLEVPAGSPLEAVERAYQRLIERYDPERHQGSPERQRTARDLTRSLTRAYHGVVAYLRSKQPRE